MQCAGPEMACKAPGTCDGYGGCTVNHDLMGAGSILFGATYEVPYMCQSPGKFTRAISHWVPTSTSDATNVDCKLDAPTCMAVYSSGAMTKAHVDALAAVADSVIPATTCTTNAECAALTATPICDPRYNRCGPLRTQGQHCDTHAQCASGSCADGFCCSSACDSGCTRCDLEGHRYVECALF